MNKQLDLDNLTKEDFVEMARYVQHLEEQLEGCKAAGITLMTQRNNLQKQFNYMKYQNERGIVEKPVNKVLDVDFDLINPEQYREKPNQR
jgi:hypothetical protein